MQASPTGDTHDLVLVGTSFASMFFLRKYLERAPASARVLVLEWGQRQTNAWWVQNYDLLRRAETARFVNTSSWKEWVFFAIFGGASNGWWGCTPRMLPSDFRLRSLHGHGEDWPLSYDDLEEHYSEAEEIMSIAGPTGETLYPRSRPYPQPPHRLTRPCEALKAAYPGQFHAMPTARARKGGAGRGVCCAAGICARCPVDAKFTISNGMKDVIADERVSIVLGARARAVVTEAGVARGVLYTTEDGAEHSARGELVGIGASALFNPFLLEKSGLGGGQVGVGLMEQTSVPVDINLAGMDGFGGSTSIPGHGYMMYDGDHRDHFAAALMESWNVPQLRLERGKWLQRHRLKLIFEDHREPFNKVTVSASDPDKPQTTFLGHSGHTMASIGSIRERLERAVLPALPVESYTVGEPNRTEAHILGTCVMGTDPATSVVDADLRHHQVRNLLVLGGSAFPTAAPANPTLTICALSLRAAARLSS